MDNDTIRQCEDAYANQQAEEVYAELVKPAEARSIAAPRACLSYDAFRQAVACLYQTDFYPSSIVDNGLCDGCRRPRSCSVYDTPGAQLSICADCFILTGYRRARHPNNIIRWVQEGRVYG